MIWLACSSPDIEADLPVFVSIIRTGIEKWLLHPPSGGSGVALSHAFFAPCMDAVVP